MLAALIIRSDIRGQPGNDPIRYSEYKHWAIDGTSGSSSLPLVELCG